MLINTVDICTVQVIIYNCTILLELKQKYDQVLSNNPHILKISETRYQYQQSVLILIIQFTIKLYTPKIDIVYININNIIIIVYHLTIIIIRLIKIKQYWFLLFLFQKNPLGSSLPGRHRQPSSGSPSPEQPPLSLSLSLSTMAVAAAVATTTRGCAAPSFRPPPPSRDLPSPSPGFPHLPFVHLCFPHLHLCTASSLQPRRITTSRHRLTSSTPIAAKQTIPQTPPPPTIVSKSRLKPNN